MIMPLPETMEVHELTMNSMKGYRLFVNLSASQARRRLKGLGLGVRKVQSAGRNQAVIIHTATGQHFRELARVFADCVCGGHENDLGHPIENLKNLGSTSSAWLREVGIATTADLERLGPALAYRLVKQSHPKASLNLLWALAAGLKGLDWRDLSEQERDRLRKEVSDDLPGETT
jgi:hypothetical protein